MSLVRLLYGPSEMNKLIIHAGTVPPGSKVIKYSQCNLFFAIGLIFQMVRLNWMRTTPALFGTNLGSAWVVILTSKVVGSCYIT